MRQRTKISQPPAQQQVKMLPNAPDLESAVLGAILLEPACLEIVMMILKAEYFYSDAHKAIFSACVELKLKGQIPDILTVAAHLTKTGELDAVGGAYYITKLTNNVVSAANIENHSYILLEHHMMRQLAIVTGRINDASFNKESDVFEILDEMQNELVQITNMAGFGKVHHLSDCLMEVIKTTAAARDNPGKLTGVPSGFVGIDRTTNGWQPSDLIIVAARPSVGKTAFALNIAKNAAKAVKPVPVLIFSLEMSAQQLSQRILSADSAIKLEKIKRGELSEAEMNHIYKTSGELAEVPIYIDDRAGITLFEVIAKSKQSVVKKKTGLIIIDYLQLIDAGLPRNTPREQQISHISRSLKKLAKDCNVPVIALSQLTRAVDGRADNEPKLSDLRESGAIEQDADLVLFIFKATKEDVQRNPMLANKGMIKISKHRNGSLFDGVFDFFGETQRWEDEDPQYQQKFSPISKTQF